MSNSRILLCRLFALTVATVLAFAATSWAGHPLQHYVFEYGIGTASAQKPVEISTHLASIPLPHKRPIKIH